MPGVRFTYPVPTLLKINKMSDKICEYIRSLFPICRLGLRNILNQLQHENIKSLDWIPFQSSLFHSLPYNLEETAKWLAANNIPVNYYKSVHIVFYFKIVFQTEEDRTLFLLFWKNRERVYLGKIAHYQL